MPPPGQIPGFRFAEFALDPADRRLDGASGPVELNARYLDALILLVSEQGRLVSKDRFMGEVWRGIPVTDEALTQCIRTLRKALGDDAAQPRFIETVPKHGYRFIAEVAPVGQGPAKARAAAPAPLSWRAAGLLGLGGTIGGGLAGLVGGLIYGFAGASQPLGDGTGAASLIVVLVALTVLVALSGGAGVAFGIAAAGLAPSRAWWWTVGGGAAGGFAVGGAVKLLGLDAFNLLLGRTPGDITGAPEGALVGAAVGLGAWLAQRSGASLRRGLAIGAACGGAGGLLCALLGGRLMLGSLVLLAESFPASRLRPERIGMLFGDDGFGAVTQLASGALEGALFGGCLVAALILVRRTWLPDVLAPRGALFPH